MVSLKQELSVLDYFGPLVVFVAFFAIVFIISATCILWFCVDDADGAALSKWRLPGSKAAYTVRRPSQGQVKEIGAQSIIACDHVLICVTYAKQEECEQCSQFTYHSIYDVTSSTKSPKAKYQASMVRRMIIWTPPINRLVISDMSEEGIQVIRSYGHGVRRWAGLSIGVIGNRYKAVHWEQFLMIG